MRLEMPDGGGETVVGAVHGERPGVRFLALSVSDSAEDVVRVIRAGARGYVTKSISPDELVDAIHRTAEGDAAFSPWLAGFVLDALRLGRAGPRRRGRSDDRRAHRPRAGGVAADRPRLHLQGDRRPPAPLHLSVKTIETHVSSVLRKLQLSNRNELTRWPARRRMI